MTSLTRRSLALLPVFAPLLSPELARAAAELNPAAVTFKLPDQIEWKTPTGDNRGVQNAVLAGDPTKEGLYVVMTKWLAGNHFSHPHFHPHDRFITVLKGTWWAVSYTHLDVYKRQSMPRSTASCRMCSSRRVSASRKATFWRRSIHALSLIHI